MKTVCLFSKLHNKMLPESCLAPSFFVSVLVLVLVLL